MAADGVTAGKWQANFVDCGGYDCMTHAWFIQDGNGKTLAVLDCGLYGQNSCDYDYSSSEAKDAEIVARQIVREHNAFEAMRDALAILVDHAQEYYPHFENPRGQEDIKRALDALKLAEGK